jgi:hypothetical protein
MQLGTNVVTTKIFLQLFIKLASCNFVQIHHTLLKQHEMRFILSLTTQFI